MVVIGVWLFCGSQAYCFESGLWQTSMLRKMIPDRLGTGMMPKTLRATLQDDISLRIARQAPYKSADLEKRKKFAEEAQGRAVASPSRGTSTFTRARRPCCRPPTLP